MGSIWNANLTDSEIERYAFLYGKRHLAAFAATVEDQVELDERHENELEVTRVEAHAEGVAEGMGMDTDRMLTALRHEVDTLKADHQRSRDNLLAVQKWLSGDECKTVKDRKAFASRLNAAINATPRH